MQLIDTIVIVSSIDAESKHHHIARKYLDAATRDEQTFVPQAVVLEFDLVMKGRNYTAGQKKDAFDWLGDLVPDAKLIANSVGSMKKSIDLQENGMSYFDSLVSALAIGLDATVLTPDLSISQVVKTKW